MEVKHMRPLPKNSEKKTAKERQPRLSSKPVLIVPSHPSDSLRQEIREILRRELSRQLQNREQETTFL
ncbi:MAG: hypothetical protein NC341_11685 [Blautia sp.]|nr:hypothetical protein [Blautia sp.]